MSSSLRVDYQGLEEDTIVQLKRCEAKIANVYDQMQKKVSALMQYMEAEAATAYMNEFTSLVGPSIESMETIVKEYHMQLQQIADRFAEVDKNISNQVKVN